MTPIIGAREIADAPTETPSIELLNTPRNKPYLYIFRLLAVIYVSSFSPPHNSTLNFEIRVDVGGQKWYQLRHVPHIHV